MASYSASPPSAPPPQGLARAAIRAANGRLEPRPRALQTAQLREPMQDGSRHLPVAPSRSMARYNLTLRRSAALAAAQAVVALDLPLHDHAVGRQVLGAARHRMLAVGDANDGTTSGLSAGHLKTTTSPKLHVAPERRSGGREDQRRSTDALGLTYALGSPAAAPVPRPRPTASDGADRSELKCRRATRSRRRSSRSARGA